MSQRTFSKPLPQLGRSLSWENQPDIHPGEIAREEATLTCLPFARPSRPRNSSPRIYESFEWTAEGRDGTRRDFFQRFRSGKNVNLPGPTADRVFSALMSIPPEKEGEGIAVETHVGNLIRFCHLSAGGTTRDRIRRALRRLEGLSIETNAIWDADKQKYVDGQLDLFSSVDLEEKGNKGGSKKKIRVEWSPAVAKMMNTWTKPVNLNPLMDVSSTIARKLYRVSALGAYQEGKLVEDLEILGYKHLGMTKREFTSELKHALFGPAEMLKKQKLARVRFEKVEDHPTFASDWRVEVRPMEKMHRIYENIEDPQYWACHLKNRNVYDLKNDPLGACRGLVDKEGVDRVRSVIKEYDRRLDAGVDFGRDPTWITSKLRRDFSKQELSKQDSPKEGGADDGDRESGAEFAKPGYESSETESSGSGSSPVKERPPTAKIGAALKLAHRAYDNLQPEAREWVQKEYPNLPQGKKDALVDRAIGRLYLGKNGMEDLLDHLSEGSK